MALSKELIEILACPKCKGPLTQVEAPTGFACPDCNLLYKTEDGIPNFLISEAKAWKEEQKSE
jgi:hypothetical protein